MRITDNTTGVLQEVDRRISVGLKKIAPDVVSVAKIYVPVVSGDLQRSIDAKIEDNKATIGSSLVYAAKIEVSSPYLRPALEGNILNIIRVFKAR